MKTILNLNIEYFTSTPNDHLSITGEIRYHNGLTDPIGIRLTQHVSTGIWRGQIEIEHTHDVILHYHYAVKRDSMTIRCEPPIAHSLVISPSDMSDRRLELKDRWMIASSEHLIDRYPLSSILGKDEDDPQIHLEVHDREQIIVFRPAHYDAVTQYFVCGESNSMGAWDPQRAIEMIGTRDGYAAVIKSAPTSYKIIRKDEQGHWEWEQGDNRTFIPVWDSMQVEYIEPPYFMPHHERRPHFKGVVLPLFSLRTSHSYGCGDLSDAMKMLDFISASGLQVYQLLPIYDTTWHRDDRDSYPYNSITTYGIHPIYLDVKALPGYDHHPKRSEWEERASTLNDLPHLDYQATYALKEEVERTLIDAYIESGELEQDADFMTFWQQEQEQLLPYALFCTIRDLQPNKSVTTYPSYEDCRMEWVEKHELLGNDAEQSVWRYAYLQYQLYQQLQQLTDTARDMGIILKGDLPIGVGRESVDVWVEPDLFHLDKEAGAPPDAFSDLGQNWTFPTYNWEAMADDHYAWWQRRLSTMGRYFGAVRLDHILGFFRIWSIPFGEINPCLGHFVPAKGYTSSEILSRISDGDLKELSQPIVDTEIINEIWGEQQEDAIKHDLIAPEEDGRWRIVDHPIDQVPKHLRKAYQSMRGEVLLVTDDNGQWHPRVMLAHTYRYKMMTPEAQKQWLSLHHDFYYHRNEALWQATAVSRLSAIQNAGGMLLCAEDLGMLPQGIKSVLSDLEMLSLEIIRMPKSMGTPFVRPMDIPYGAVVSTSTHDMSSLRGWWQTLSDGERRHLTMDLYRHSDTPTAHPQPSDLIKGLADSSAMFMILPLQDWCTLTGYGSSVPAEEEQVNHPEDANHVWQYRMYGTLEELLRQEDLITAIRSL